MLVEANEKPMEKFEKHIKEKLDGREIEPSANAWDRIAKEIPQGQDTKGRKKMRYAVAASFVGVLMVIGILFFRNGTETVEIPIVEEDILIEKESQEEEILEFQSDDIELVETPKASSPESKYEPIPEETPTAQVLVEMEKTEQMDKMPLKDSTVFVSEDIISKKVNEVMTQVTLLENMADAKITDAEVDSLLRAAQREILTNRSLKFDGKVDAMALLTEVEGELDESFRDQIFEALKQGYLKVKTAVADRNN